MQDTIFTQVLLPAILGVIMFGMGLSLVKEDFIRIAKVPKSVAAGLLGQVILLPLFAFALVTAFSAPIEIAIGLMILAACPGGTTSNLISHIARANLALSVSLTAITTVICVITTPFLIKFSINHFTQSDTTEFSLIGISMKLVILLIVPISLGMLLRHFFSKVARRAEPFFRHFSTIFMLMLIVVIAYQEREMMQASFPDIFYITFSLNIGATIMGVLLAKAFSLSKKDGLTLGIEIGTQNASMAMLIAITFIENSAYSIAAGIYGVTMYLGAFLLVGYHKMTLAPAVAD
ncbi:bile acid:sodium symporter family protein [Brumicola nitratireducens]|uniref:Bile acid:sodium symporter n=1 Tax=Glaciecola nitratireducens (strain JCM 12485 / KCTC 12276 / FR1064) TaxID=1085623 RepID=G4QI69_GLANF|nr:bile acid:sodium symporter family protein [Glaciecola nitratireducens]AEP30683.1 bile acid:sodium symporter [Glaciecola nitratireducens FR1064]